MAIQILTDKVCEKMYNKFEYFDFIHVESFLSTTNVYINHDRILEDANSEWKEIEHNNQKYIYRTKRK